MNAFIPVGTTGVPRLALSYDETAATFDPLTSELILSDAVMTNGFEIMLTALDAAGESTGVYRLSAVALGVAPRALGTLADLDLDQASGSRTVNAAAGFTGEVRTYELVNPPAGVSIDGVTGAIVISTVDPMTAANVTVRANNAAGSATQSFQVTVRFHHEAPVAVGRLAAIQLNVGAPALVVNAASAFAGVVTLYALENAPANVAINAASGVVTITPVAPLANGAITVRASNPAGSASQTFSLTILLGLNSPVAVGTLPAVQLSLGAAPFVVNAAAAFSGSISAYVLENAPAAVTIDAITGVVTIAATAVLATTPVTVRASNAAGSAAQTFPITINPFAATDFNTAESLSALTFITPVAPTWTSTPEGYGRLVTGAKSRAHGNWSGARGDGLYRTLVRWSGASLAASVDRRFSFGARIRLEGSAWYGIRVETFATTAGDRRLHIREYAGDATSFVALATANVGWDYDTWYWFEVEVIGSSVRGRLYPELGTAPDWQVTATTTQMGTGAFGPGGFPALQQSPVIDVRRIEYIAPRT